MSACNSPLAHGISSLACLDRPELRAPGRLTPPGRPPAHTLLPQHQHLSASPGAGSNIKRHKP